MHGIQPPTRSIYTPNTTTQPPVQNSPPMQTPRPIVPPQQNRNPEPNQDTHLTQIHLQDISKRLGSNPVIQDEPTTPSSTNTSRPTATKKENATSSAPSNSSTSCWDRSACLISPCEDRPGWTNDCRTRTFFWGCTSASIITPSYFMIATDWQVVASMGYVAGCLATTFCTPLYTKCCEHGHPTIFYIKKYDIPEPPTIYSTVRDPSCFIACPTKDNPCTTDDTSGNY